MKRSWVRWTIVVLAAFALQVAVFGDLRFGGVHPDLLLLVAVVAGLVGGPARGASVGFAAGVCVDLMLPGRLGTSGVAYALCGFGVGVIGESLIRSARSIVIGLVMAGSALGVVLYAGLAHLLGQGSLGDPRLIEIIGIVSLVNGVLCIPVVFVAQWAEDVAPLARYQ